jgi:hypothetical protein
MALNCPNKSHPLYQATLEKLNGDEYALYRLYAYHAVANPGLEYEKIMERFDTSKYSNSMKIHTLASKVSDLDRDDTGNKHKYYFKSRPDVEINSMSRELDKVDELAYHGNTEKTGYADTGTNVHKAFETIANTTNKAKSSISASLVEDLNLPPDSYDKLRKLEKELTKDGGILVLEQKLISDGDENKGLIAGATDIVRFNKDGSYDIFDLKTVNVTPSVRKRINNGGKAWDPTIDKYYKAKRYSTQIMGYGRMAENVLLQPPKSYNIIPIVVETENDREGTPIINFDILPSENIESYGMMEFASNQLDKIFNQSSFIMTTQGSDRIKDHSSSIYTSLTGDVTGQQIDSGTLATTIWKRRVQRNQGLGRVWGYTTSDNTFVPFVNQTDYKQQIAQIENEYVSTRKKFNTDLSYSVKNYLTTGKEEDIRNIGPGSDRVINLLKNFVGRANVEVTSLNKIKGFDDKLNWVLLKEHKDKSSVTHLIYIGTDNLKATFGTSFNNSSVFGKFLDETTARNKTRTTLNNTIGDARSLEGTIIAMKLKADNPDIRFGITSVFGMGGQGFAQQIDLQQNLTTISNAIREPVLRKELFKDDLLELSSVEGIFDYKRYQADWIASLMHDIDMYWEERGLDIKTLKQYYKTYDKDAVSHRMLEEKMRDMLIRRTDMGLDSQVDYNTYLLSMAYLQLTGINLSLTPEGMISSSVGVPFLIKNETLQEVNEILQNTQTKMIDEFWKSYKQPFVKVLADFMKVRSPLSRMEDRFVGDTPRHYSHLFKTATVKVQTEKGVSEKELPMFEFKTEGSPEFAALSEEDKKLIATANDMMQKMAAQNNIEWRRGQLPLVRATVANRFFNAMRTGGVAQYTQLVNAYLTDLEASYGQGEDKAETLDNIFRHQSTDELSRQSMLGLQQDGFVNYNQYSQWSTNVEQIMDVFVLQALKTKYMNDVSASMRAVKSVFNWYQSNLLDERLNYNVDFLNWFHTVNVIGRDIDSGSDTKGKLNRIARAMNRGAGLYYIALDATTAAASAVGNELTLLSQSIANSVSDISGINASTYLKAKGIITKSLGTVAFDKSDYEKINQLMFQFRLFNQDMTQMLSGYHREGDKFLFRTKWLFSLMNAADWEARSSLMVGTMLEEGSWDAYSINADGQLVYDETKDKRFTGEGKYSKEEAAALRKLLAEQQGVGAGQQLKMGHDDRMGTSIRTTANYMFGGYDKETKSMLNFKWWGKLFIAQKNWLPAKLQRWTAGRFDSALMGEYVFEKGPEGELVPVWKGDQMEGIILSMATYIKNLQRYAQGIEENPWKSLSKTQKQNITRGVSDFMLIGLSMLLYMSMPDDDDETVMDDYFAEVLRRGMDDLAIFYNVLRADDFLWTPIPLKMLNQTMNKVFNTVTNGVTVDQVLDMMPVVNSVNDTIDSITYDEETE